MLNTSDLLPWTSEADFVGEASKTGLVLAALWCTCAYTLVDKYPQLKRRLHWMWKKSSLLTPELFH